MQNLSQRFFSSFDDALTDAKQHPGATLKRANDGKGWLVYDVLSGWNQPQSDPKLLAEIKRLQAELAQSEARLAKIADAEKKAQNEKKRQENIRLEKEAIEGFRLALAEAKRQDDLWRERVRQNLAGTGRSCTCGGGMPNCAHCGGSGWIDADT